MKGVASSALFFTTRSAPFCWQTKIRPSGAMAIAVGVTSPEAMVVSLKPAGSVAALMVVQRSSVARTVTERMSERSSKPSATRHRDCWPLSPMRRIVLVVLLCLSLRAGAQDVLSIGSGSMQVPVTVTKNTANPVQGIAFRILYDGTAIASMSFTRTGPWASESPLYENWQQGIGFFSYIVLFAAPANASGQIGVLTATSSAAPGSVIPLRFDPPSAMLSNQNASVVETVANGNLSLVNGSVTVTALTAPTGLVATANGTTQVNLTWNAVAGASHYEVWRSFDGGAFALLDSPASPSLIDGSVVAGKTWLYRVRAVAGVQTSPFSAVKAATTIVFTDDPLVPRSTRIKAVHITELRAAVNAMRASAGLAPLAADPTIGSGQRIRAQHITALRTGLNEARAAIGLAALTYTDATLTVIKAVHVQELRSGVK